MKNTRKFRKNILWLIGIVIFFCRASIVGAFEYQVSQLTFGDFDIIGAVMNNNGQIFWSAYAYNTDPSRSSILTLIDGDAEINLPNDNLLSFNLDINDVGDVVWATSSDACIKCIIPYYYDGTEIIQLDAPTYGAGFPEINNNGQIAWNSHNSKYSYSPRNSIYLYDGVDTKEIFSSSRLPSAPHLNENDQVLINTNVLPFEGGVPEVVLYDGTNLITLGEGRNPQINNKGQVVWWASELVNSVKKPIIYFYDGTNTIKVGEGTYPKINDKGQILWPGPIYDSYGYARGYGLHLYEAGETLLIESPRLGGATHPDDFRLNNQGTVILALTTYHGYPTYGFTGKIYLYDGAETSIIVDLDKRIHIRHMNDLGEILFSGSEYYENLYLAKPITNTPPLAEAGINRTTECSGAYGATFTLDGSDSTDPDGDMLTFTWTGPFGTRTGETTTVTLPLGTHTVTLTVDDGKGGTATDTVELTVEDTTPPTVTKATLSGDELQPGLYLSDVLFELEAIDTCSGVASVSYTVDGYQTVAQGSSASTTISVGGDHAITYEASDNAGNVSASGSLAFSLFEANETGLSDLIGYFLDQGLIDPQLETSLTSQAMIVAYEAFINHVEAQSGKKIDHETAQVLIEAAQTIMDN